MAKRVLLFAALLTVSCATSSTVQLNPARMADWTQRLRDSQSDEPYLLVHSKGNRRLIVVAVQHDNDPASATFRLVRSAFEIWPVDSLIVEGAASDAGANFPGLMALADETLDASGQQPGGETVPALQSARRGGGEVWGGEANDRDVLRLAQANGAKQADVLGFYVLRVIPQWLRDGTLSGTSDATLVELVDRQLGRSTRSLGISEPAFSDFGGWASWYRSTNQKAIGDGLHIEEVGPLVDGPWPTNRIAWTIAKARDAHLLGLIERQLDAGKSVVVVFGGSHAAILQPALEDGLGLPCYVGTDLAAARAKCLT